MPSVDVISKLRQVGFMQLTSRVMLCASEDLDK